MNDDDIEDDDMYDSLNEIADIDHDIDDNDHWHNYSPKEKEKIVVKLASIQKI